MENKQFCQSCAMPLTDEVLGTEQDGSKSADYCSYCYQQGKFTSECTMDEMIALCAPMMVQHDPGMTEEAAAEQMRGFFPQLKRWSAK